MNWLYVHVEVVTLTPQKRFNFSQTQEGTKILQWSKKNVHKMSGKEHICTSVKILGILLAITPVD